MVPKSHCDLKQHQQACLAGRPTSSSLRHSAHTPTWITLKVKASIKQFQNRAIFKVPCYPWLAIVGKERIYYRTRSEATFLFMQPLACAQFQIFLANIALILFWNNSKNKKDWVSLQLVSCTNSSEVAREIISSPVSSWIPISTVCTALYTKE